MFVEVVPMILSLLVGFARRGDIMRIARLKLAIPYLALAAIAVQVVAINAIPASSAFPYLYTGSLLLVVVFLVANRAIPWSWMLAVGVGLNLLVMAANGGRMPAPPMGHAAGAGAVSANGAGGAGDVDGGAVESAVTHTTQIDPETVLSFLGDVIPLDAGALGGYYLSAGDIVLALGIFLLIQAVMVPRRTKNRHYAEKAPLIDV